MDKDEAATRRLIDVLQAADPDPWRQRVRDAMARKDRSALANLVKSADLDRQPAATLTFLSSALRASGKDREQELVLRRAQWKYPADYWINFRLGTDLIWRQSPNDVRDGIGYMRAAVALRPESAHSVMNLGNGYEHLGQHDQAIACFRKAIELQAELFGHAIPISASRSVEKACTKRRLPHSNKPSNWPPGSIPTEPIQNYR